MIEVLYKHDFGSNIRYLLEKDVQYPIEFSNTPWIFLTAERTDLGDRSFAYGTHGITNQTFSYSIYGYGSIDTARYSRIQIVGY